MARTIVMKFGGASVDTPEQFHMIAKRVQERRSTCDRLVVVVSAMGNSTDQLIRLARCVHPSPPRREYDMLITVGERVSIALLAMALERQGVDAVSFTGSQSGIITSSHHQAARILAVKPHRLLQTLEQGQVAIVAGFQGVSEEKEITTLGRGGSDTTAVALGVALGAEQVEFYKDVPGVFSADPKHHANAKHVPHLSYAEAFMLASEGHSFLAPRCIQLAEKNRIPLIVQSFRTPVSDQAQLLSRIYTPGPHAQHPVYEGVEAPCS